MKRVICFDLDMTLLDHKNYQVPDSAMEGLERLRKNNYIVIATGRDMDNHYSRQFKELIRPDAIIHTNGTRITVGDQEIYSAKMDKKLMKRLLDFAEAHNYAVGFTIGDDDYYIHPEVVRQNDYINWGESGRHFKDPMEMLNMDVHTLAYVGNPEGAKDIEEHFEELKLPLFAGKTGADIIEKSSSKALGLKRLCEYYNIRMEDSVAFGDSMNDIEILQEAGIGVAMGNAVEEVKKVADYVTSDIDDDGIWNACIHLNLF